MYDLYTTLKTLCEERGISLAKMCLDLGMPKSTTTELKKGRAKSLSSAKITKIAEYFDVSIDFILGREINNKNFSAELSQEEADLLKRWEELKKLIPNLSPEKKKLIKKVFTINDDEAKKVSKMVDIIHEEKNDNEEG